MLLLDTHAFIWLASDLTKLPRLSKDIIQHYRGNILLSAISGLEIALAVKRKRLLLPVDPDQFIARALEQHGIHEVQVSAAIGCQAAGLADHHNDPFDRIIIATAVIHRAKILSRDSMIGRYEDVEVLWD